MWAILKSFHDNERAPLNDQRPRRCYERHPDTDGLANRQRQSSFNADGESRASYLVHCAQLSSRVRQVFR